MKRKKGLKAVIIAAVLIFAVTCTAYGDLDAAQLTDIDKSWAKQYIVNVYEDGLMDSAGDNLFKPTENVRNYDAIVGIGRMMNKVYQEDLETLKAKYKEKILDKFEVPEAIRGEVALALEKGVITDFDISAFKDNPYSTKKDICMYLGKAFGIAVKPDAPPTILPAYTDVLFIPTAYKPYVRYLIDIGVIGEKGDVNGKLNPDAFVTRETFAKMLDISSKQFQKEKSGIEIPEDGSEDQPASGQTEDTYTDGSDQGNGTGNDQDTDTTAVPPITVEDEGTPDVTGYVDEIIAEYGNIAVNVKDDAGSTTRKIYKVSENVVCSLDGLQVNYYKLKKDDVVKLYMDNDVITKIIAESKIKKAVGELVDISTTDKTVLTMRTDSGEVKSYTITAKTVVIKDGKEADWQNLNKGNKLVLTSSYDELLEVNADGVVVEEKGVIESITYSRTTTPKIVLTIQNDQQTAYYTAKNIEIEGSADDVYDLRPGMLVDSRVNDGEIVKLTILNDKTAVSIDTKGVVKFVDPDLRIITIVEYNGDSGAYAEKKVFAANAKIVDKTLTPIDIDDVKEGNNLIIIGKEGLDGITADSIMLVDM